MTVSPGPGFQNLIDYIETDIGFPTSHYNEDYLERRIRSRMRRTNCQSIPEYQQYLEQTSGEPKHLLDSFSINVTEFFRNAPVWDGIQCVLQQLSQTSTDPIRVWSAACADGREPYSLALLALVDDNIADSRIDILATDINETALQIARNGAYEKTQTEDIPCQLEYLPGVNEYITEQNGVFKLTHDVRSLVTFKKHDLIRGDSKSGFDLILCRNLLIYIDSEYEPPIINSIRNALREDGYLVIGKSETLPPRLMDKFIAKDNRQRIYQATTH